MPANTTLEQYIVMLRVAHGLPVDQLVEGTYTGLDLWSKPKPPVCVPDMMSIWYTMKY